MKNKLTIEDLNYDLPTKAIKQYPYKFREAAKILDVRTKKIHTFSNILRILPVNSTLVFNQSTVQKARFKVKTIDTKAKVEILITKIIDNHQFFGIIKSNVKSIINKKLKLKDYVIIPISKNENVYSFIIEDISIQEAIKKYGTIPLPPYIKDDSDKYSLYQTEFANGGFSIAAPTAGLHFTNDLIKCIEDKGISITYVNLNVGLGTFLPIVDKEVDNHTIHSEEYSVTTSTYDKLVNDKKNNRKIIPVGTTSLRVIETIFSKNKVPLNGTTDLFIKRGYEFRIADGLITNFHAPRSSLLAIIELILGSEWKDVYEYALDSNMKFLSFGDSMLLDINL